MSELHVLDKPSDVQQYEQLTTTNLGKPSNMQQDDLDIIIYQ